jgi:hypothetical protein
MGMRDIIVKRAHDVEHRSSTGNLMAVTALSPSDKPISVTNFIADDAVKAGAAEEAGNARQEVTAEEAKGRVKR